MEQQYQNMQPGPQNNFEPKSGSNKKFWIILVLAVIAGALLIVWFKIPEKDRYGFSLKQQNRQEAQNLPEGFPSDFPVDTTAEPASKPQMGPNGEIIIQLTSNLAPSQAYAAYLNYFETHGWAILSKVQNLVAGNITAKSPSGDIISLGLSPASENKSLINVSLAKIK